MRFVSLAIYYYRWSQDPFTQGAYSAPVVGFTSQDFNKLGEKLGRLYFGGEATSEDWYGFMQGAYFTGEKIGKLIACQILPGDSECKAPEKKKPKNETAAAVSAKSARGVLLLFISCSFSLICILVCCYDPEKCFRYIKVGKLKKIGKYALKDI